MEACVAAAARQLRPVDAGNPRAARRRILAPVFCLNAGAERGEERRAALLGEAKSWVSSAPMLTPKQSPA